MGKICHQRHQHRLEWNDQQKVKQERGSLQSLLWSRVSFCMRWHSEFSSDPSPLVFLVLGLFHRKPGKEKNNRERDTGATWQLHWEIGQRTGFSEAWSEQLLHAGVAKRQAQISCQVSCVCFSIGRPQFDICWIYGPTKEGSKASGKPRSTRGGFRVLPSGLAAPHPCVARPGALRIGGSCWRIGEWKLIDI